MRLPDILIARLAEHMPTHGEWHTARMLRVWIPYAARPRWDAARGFYPDVLFVTQAGSGRQFLEFHRLMLRHFKWIVDNTEGHNYLFEPWDGVPTSLREGPANPGGFTQAYLDAQRAGVDKLIAPGAADLDTLGSFLESTRLDNSFGSNVHNLCHAAIASYEYGVGTGFEGAEMDDFATAHFNRQFWNLHGWLDNIYADWQRSNGEPVYQLPLNPGMHHDDHGTEHSSSHLDSSAVVVG